MLRHYLFTDPQLAVCSVAMWGFVEYVCDCFWICLIFFVDWIHPNGNIYSLAHACQIFQALAFFFLFFFLCYLDGLFCCGQMPLTWFLSCWAHWWSALNILLSILWAKWAVVQKCRFCKKLKLLEWVKRSLFSCPHLSPVLSLVCLATVYEILKLQAVSEHPLKTITGSVYKH